MHAMLGNFLFETQLVIFSDVFFPLTTNFPWHDVLVDQHKHTPLTMFFIATQAVGTRAIGCFIINSIRCKPEITGLGI